MILFSSEIFVVLLLWLRHLLVTLLTAIVFNPHPGHARDFAWYRGQRPSPARVIKKTHNNNSRTRKYGTTFVS